MPVWLFIISFAAACACAVWALLRAAPAPSGGGSLAALWETRLRPLLSKQTRLGGEEGPSPERVALLSALLGGAGAAAGCALTGFPLGLSWVALGMIPFSLVSTRARARMEAIDRDLPFAADLLTLSVEGGLHVEWAFRRLAPVLSEGPLKQEIGRLLAERSVGRGWGEALREWGARTGSDAVRDLAATLTQAETTGMSVAPVLRNWGADLRRRRLERAEARAHRAPVAMLFPILLCILPSVFLVLLGPPLARAFG